MLLLKTRDRWFESHDCENCGKKSNYGELTATFVVYDPFDKSSNCVKSYSRRINRRYYKDGHNWKFVCPNCIKEVLNNEK